MSKDSVVRVLLVSTLLCVVCSVIVSLAAVGLRDRQEANAARDKKRNVLLAAGLIKDGDDVDVDELFGAMEPVLVDLASGKPVTDGETAGFDMEKALKDSDATVSVSNEEFPGGVSARPRQVVVYLHKEAGELKTAVLPVVGKGLWSTMYGFLALGPDGDTVKGLVFYSHGETPGLGGEVDSEKFKAQFRGQKRLFDDEAYAFAILKAGRAQDRPEHQADGISGATITCRGVDEMIKYWVSVYGPYLAVLKGGG